MGEKIKKDDIIKALLDMAFAHSTSGTSLSDIAGALGIKKASLYNHFESREDLILRTTKSCAEYLASISFIPADIDSVAKRYPPETVLKGIVSRYIKMHEKSPLFQIYTFVESQKYFSPEAAKIIKDEREKITAQTCKVFEALLEAGTVSVKKELIPDAAQWFCSGVCDIMSIHLLERKKIVMENPKSGEGELFTLSGDDSSLDRINSLAESFSQLLK